MERVLSPFNTDQIASLTAFQVEAAFKSIRCKHCDTTMIATYHGFVCVTCDVIAQDWAWDWMLNWEWKNMSNSVGKFLSGDHSEFHSRFKKQLKGNTNDLR